MQLRHLWQCISAAVQEGIPQCREQQLSMNQQGWVSFGGLCCAVLCCGWHWAYQGVRVAPRAL